MAKETFNEIDEFCWQLRDGINEIVENHVKNDVITNLSFKERKTLEKLIMEKNKIHVGNDPDKNLGPENADKCDVIGESKTQLFDVAMYRKLSAEEVKTLVKNCISNLRIIVESHFYKGNCSQKEKELLMSNINNYVIPHFYIKF